MMTLTNSGRNLLARAILGQELKFTRGCIGDGEIPDSTDEKSLTALIHNRKMLEITALRTANEIGTAELEFETDNRDMPAGFFVREYGLYALDPESGHDILYAYCNKRDEAPYIEAFNGTDIITFTLTFLTVIEQSPNVTAAITNTNQYVTHSRLDQHLTAVWQNIESLNLRVHTITKTILDLVRSDLWGTADIIKVIKDLEAVQDEVDMNTSALLAQSRSILWGTANNFNAERRLRALEEKIH
ncbi:MAG: hypothetical protein IJR85_04830 [Synergistaceae bacterium]|nr:hypothetical protein [Synergistaceae bacterium]